ncbi:MAG TPA: hypothetical protein VK666_21715 [Chryseolinea sp.]|nr:hypothetical protein [Chryseolinea sp.]
MRILINDKEVVFPSSLSEITLGQRIAFQQQHGNDLDKMAKSIMEMKEGPLQDLEVMEFNFEKMFRTFAFFAGTTVEAIKESKFIDDVASIYYSCLAVLFDEEAALDYQTEFIWEGETWVLGSAELNQASKKKFAEFVDAKQIVKDLVHLGQSKWEYMLPLCAIYLRRKDEPYSEDLVYEGSDRQELMKSLPMNIAMQVGFFLTASMNISMNILKFSGSPEPKAAVSM